MSNNSIGDRLRSFGKIHFNSLNEFAKSIEIEPTDLQKYLSGQKQPDVDILIKLIALGCDIRWLLIGSNNELAPVLKFVGPTYKELQEEVANLRAQLNELKPVIKD